MKWLIIVVTVIALALPATVSAAGGKQSTPARPAPSCAVVSGVEPLMDGMYADVYCPDLVIRVSVGAFQPLPAIGAAGLVKTAGGAWYLVDNDEAYLVVLP